MMLKTSILSFAAILLVFGEVSSQCVRDSVSNCVIYDNTQIKAFDGNVYSFNSACGYTLASIPAVGLEISYLRSTSRLQIIYAGRTFQISISAAGVVTFTRDGVTYSIPETLNGVSVSKPGRMVIAEINALGVKIRYDGNTAELIQDNVGNTMQTNGMCGNNDGCPNNDLVMKDGTTTVSAIAWANSWAMNSCAAATFTSACGTNARLLAQAQTYCTNLFGQSQFTGCSAYSSSFTNICTSNYCGCKLANRNDCMCDMLDAFARTCQTKNNNIISWRTPTLCPIQCANMDQTYSTCAPNRRQLSCGEDPVTNPLQYDCEEGCYCPDGMRLYNGQCLFVQECPCVYQGTVYNPGATIAQECNTCTCTNGKFVCTTKSCVVDGSCNGDPHYTTFDTVRYDFMGKCMYYLVRGIGYDIICDHYIRTGGGYVKNVNSGGPSFCLKVIVLVDGDVIEIGQNQVVKYNGKTIDQLPYKKNGIRITKPSSQFTDVKLRNNVVASFNGLWYARVTIPTSLKNRVKGLFGYYSAAAGDDLTMPDGTIAPNANVFGHSWKVPGSCDNEFTGDVPHPCDVNPSKRPNAEQTCSAITGPLFAGCSDDPTGDYNDCVYDGCLCPDGDTTCLCEFFEIQGRKCNAKGITVDWRATITECAITCPPGQTYQTCGDSCKRSCQDISDDPECVTQCVPGCNCPTGQTLNNKGQCIPIAQCPCVYNEVQFPAAFTFIDIENNNKYVCENALWTITDATRQDVTQYPSLDDFNTECDANQFLVYAGCKQVNTLTCLNKHLEEIADYDNCVAGCECMEGFIYDTELAMCVRPEDCPCMYKGISYPDNAVINNRVEKCTCVLGLWECVPQTDYWAMCSAADTVHVRTFDETIYSFQGYCEYVMFEHTSGTGVFRVTLETSSCNVGACIAAVYIHHRAEDGRVENVVLVTGEDFLAPPGLQNLVISNLVLSVLIDVVGLGVRVIVNKEGWVHIHVSPAWLTMESFGLCGKYDNDASNDLEITGVIVNGVGDFVDLNRLDIACGAATQLIPSQTVFANDPCNYLLSDVFKTCRLLVPVDGYLQICMMNAQTQLNLPAAERTNHYCEVIGAYAQECNEADASVNWRTAEMCPFECPVGKQYYPCDTPCPKENCANTVGYPTLCQDKVCSEACNTPECPAGTIYQDATNAQCIPPSECPTTLRGSGRRGVQWLVSGLAG